ncbi:MAG: hypothetical protein GY772_13990, partial [bacterium]|nr:hypothetical protein [bacterium]
MSGCAATAGADLAAAEAGESSQPSRASSTDEEAATAGGPAATAEVLEGKRRMQEMFRAQGCEVRCVSFSRTFRGIDDECRVARELRCDDVFDCEVFLRDPAREDEGPLAHWQDEVAAHRCCGLNGNVVAGLVVDVSFHHWLQDIVRSRMLRLCLYHAYVVRSLSNLCMCYSSASVCIATDTYRIYMPPCACVREAGRHRSVAAAHLLARLLAPDMAAVEEHWSLGDPYRPACGC